METSRKLAVAFGVSRIAYAAALLATPGRAAKPWLGEAAESGGGRVATRALAIRDGALGAGVALSVLADDSARPWLAACVVSDIVDLSATLIDRDRLPSRAAPGTVAVAGGMAAAGVALAATED